MQLWKFLLLAFLYIIIIIIIIIVNYFNDTLCRVCWTKIFEKFNFKIFRIRFILYARVIKSLIQKNWVKGAHAYSFTTTYRESLWPGVYFMRRDLLYDLNKLIRPQRVCILTILYSLSHCDVASRSTHQIISNDEDNVRWWYRWYYTE
jgi:hypothetical protein